MTNEKPFMILIPTVNFGENFRANYTSKDRWQRRASTHDKRKVTEN